MSLQVWLPLNGNINNQGCSSINFVQSGITYSAGKIGQAATFNGSNSNIANSNFSIGNIWSFSVWAKDISSTTIWQGVIILNNTGGDADIQMGLYFKSNENRLQFSYNGSYNSQIQYTPGQWNHFAGTCDGTNAKFYINGSLVYTNSSIPSLLSRKNLVIGARSTSTNVGSISDKFTGQINDVRIYDHCLSPKEVKEISKALVVHYPLDNQGFGLPNLLKNSGDLTKWNKETGVTVTWDEDKGMYKIIDSTHTQSRWGIYQDISVEPNTTYAISCTAEGLRAGCAFAVFDSTANWPGDIGVVTDGQHIRKTYTITSSANSTIGRIYLSTNCATSNVAWFSTPKIEKSSVTTPWIPNTADAEYTSFNLNSTTEIDVSGFKYNGTKSGTTSIVSNTPKYCSATYFTAGSGVFSHPNITLSKFTISFWGKHTATGKMLMGSNASTSATSNDWYWYGDNSFKYPSGEFYYLHNAGSAESLLNKWTHFVAIYDGSTISIYRNGIYEGNRSASGDKLLNYLSVGNGFAKSSYWENGYVSDFRLYATALSADDVKELYQASAQLDNKGNMYAYDFEEV